MWSSATLSVVKKSCLVALVVSLVLTALFLTARPRSTICPKRTNGRPLAKGGSPQGDSARVPPSPTATRRNPFASSAFGFAKDVAVWLDYETLYYFSTMSRANFLRFQDEVPVTILGFHCRDTVQLLESLERRMRPQFVYVARDLKGTPPVARQDDARRWGVPARERFLLVREGGKISAKNPPLFVPAVGAEGGSTSFFETEGNCTIVDGGSLALRPDIWHADLHFPKYAQAIFACTRNRVGPVEGCEVQAVVKMWEVSTGPHDRLLDEGPRDGLLDSLSGESMEQEVEDIPTIITVTAHDRVVVLIGYATSLDGNAVFNRYPMQGLLATSGNEIDKTIHHAVPTWSLLGRSDSSPDTMQKDLLATFTTPKEVLYPMSEVVDIGGSGASLLVPRNREGHLFHRYRSGSRSVEAQFLKSANLGFFKRLQLATLRSPEAWSDISREYGLYGQAPALEPALDPVLV